MKVVKDKKPTMKSIKLSQEDITGLKDWAEGIEALTKELGKLRLQKFLIDREEIINKEKLEALLNKEWVISSPYKEKHPGGYFDLEKGEFIYPE